MLSISDGKTELKVEGDFEAYETKVALGMLCDQFIMKSFNLVNGKFCPRCYSVVDMFDIPAMKDHLKICPASK